MASSNNKINTFEIVLWKQNVNDTTPIVHLESTVSNQELFKKREYLVESSVIGIKVQVEYIIPVILSGKYTITMQGFPIGVPIMVDASTTAWPVVSNNLESMKPIPFFSGWVWVMGAIVVLTTLFGVVLIKRMHNFTRVETEMEQES